MSAAMRYDPDRPLRFSPHRVRVIPEHTRFSGCTSGVKPYSDGMKPEVDDSCVMIDGPWTHRFVSANGNRFHVVEAGTGPLVLLLHGFPAHWWAWHDVMTRLAGAG